MILLFHEIVERKRLEDELRERAAKPAEEGRRMDELPAMLGHELRNPLSPILSALEILRLCSADETTGWARELIERAHSRSKGAIDVRELPLTTDPRPMWG